jgi:hypothetical protein
LFLSVPGEVELPALEPEVSTTNSILTGVVICFRILVQVGPPGPPGVPVPLTLESEEADPKPTFEQFWKNGNPQRTAVIAASCSILIRVFA